MKGLPETKPGELLLPQEGIHVTPSNINAWRDVRAADQRYSRQQLAELRRLGLHPDHVRDVIVRDKVSIREMWWPSGSPTPVYLLPCPILEGEGRQNLTVLSPAGIRKIVQPDGTKGRAKGRRP